MTSHITPMSIITCAGKNKIGKISTEIATKGKGYCSTKNIYYFYLKLHALAFRRKRIIPCNDYEVDVLTILKREAADILVDRKIFSDKIDLNSSY